MQYDHVSGIDKPISRLVQGTVMVHSKELEKGFALLDEIYKLGCNTFDTAHVYGNGDGERTLGRWIHERNIRDEVVIITKGAHHNADRNRVTPFDITSDLYDSLARLKVEMIDLYLLHRDDPVVPVGPIADVLNEHKAAGRISAFGGSNWTHERLQEAHAYAQAHGLVSFAVGSPQFSLAEMVCPPWPNCISIGGNSGAAARAWYQETQTPLFTWSSLAGGFFTGRFSRDNLDTFDTYQDRLCVESYCYADNFRRLERAAALAREKGLTLPQVALAYVLNQPLNIFALVGCRSRGEFADNIAAMEVKLTPEEIAWLELKRDEVIE